MRVRERVGSGRGREIERKSRGWKRREGGWVCVCERERVKNERGEREIERVGNGRGMGEGEGERERDSRRWEGERGGMEAFKRDRVRDGRE